MGHFYLIFADFNPALAQYQTIDHTNGLLIHKLVELDTLDMSVTLFVKKL